MLVTVSEALLGLFLYVFVGTLMCKLAKKLDLTEPLDFFIGLLWPASAPIIAFIFLLIGMTVGATALSDKVTETVTAMWEEWRA